MKNISFVVYNIGVLGGAEQVAVNIANELCKIYKVEIYSICGDNSKVPYQIDEKIKIQYGKNNDKLRIRQLIKNNFIDYTKHVKRNNIDIVFMIGVYSGVLTVLSSFFSKAKFVFCDHGALMNQWKEKDITRMRWMAAKLSDKIVVLTDRTKEDYIEYFHMKKNKVLRIYNWVDPEIVNEERKYNTQSKKILTVGRISAEKGCDLLVETAKKILPKFPEWTWDIYGDGEDFEKISNLIIQNNLKGRVVLKGKMQNVTRVFEQYSFYVLTSYREGLPLVLLEAKASKLPMISFDIETGPREIIDKKSGVLIKPYDCNAMANAMRELMCNEDIRKKMSDGTQINLNKFALENILQQWIELIESL